MSVEAENIEHENEIEVLLISILKELRYQSEMMKEAYSSTLKRDEIECPEE